MSTQEKRSKRRSKDKTSSKRKEQDAKIESKPVKTGKSDKRKSDKRKSDKRKSDKRKSADKRKRPEEKVNETLENPNKRKKENEDEVVTELSTSTKNFREKHNIVVYGEDKEYAPFESFVGFSKDLLECTKGFTKPSPIQAQTWPILLEKRDVIGLAETGSGKTLAFGLPGIAHTLEKRAQFGNKKIGPIMLILAPTRELAQQSFDVLNPIGKKSSLNLMCAYGGTSRSSQQNQLASKKVNIVVACPGRLLDLSGDVGCDLSNVSYVVLDEADRMLDMGFEKDIRTIFGLVAKERQTLMFSATWPNSIRLLANEFLTNPIRVCVGSEDLTANRRVEQIVEVIDIDARLNRLFELLEKYHKEGEKILIFVLYKKEAASIENILNKKGWPCASIHGDKSSVQRANALASFKAGKPNLLIATDVAARGLDIPLVEYVINYSFPLTVEDYVHRIGRTGRAGKSGISHTFFHKFDKPNSGALISVLRAGNANVPEDLIAFGTSTKKKEPKLGKIDLSTTSNRITFDSDSDSD